MEKGWNQDRYWNSETVIGPDNGTKIDIDDRIVMGITIDGQAVDRPPSRGQNQRMRRRHVTGDFRRGLFISADGIGFSVQPGTAHRARRPFASRSRRNHRFICTAALGRGTRAARPPSGCVNLKRSCLRRYGVTITSGLKDLPPCVLSCRNLT